MMQIILIDNRLARSRSLTFSLRHAVIAALAFLLLVAATSTGLYYITIRHAAEIQLPFIRDLFLSATKDEQQRQERYLRENLTAMAVRLGELQAQMMRLDALGERVSGLAGVKPSEINFKEAPGRGGALPSMSRDLSLKELAEQVDQMTHQVDSKTDLLGLLESELMNQRVRSRLLPTSQPVEGYNGSGFGWRIDPFTGRSAMHQGIDFTAPPGTPVLAAAGGVVVAAEFHPQFGNMIDIDHGNELVTRYAHNQKLVVKVGDIVKRGQKIAELGGTGRATGPHLHFEVQVRGVPQDPMKFLRASDNIAAANTAVANAMARPH
jgi:murein DD-endopeptidase MepM/ murein hydrolase activator NlpD